jgi:hypothetical protein
MRGRESPPDLYLLSAAFAAKPGTWAAWNTPANAPFAELKIGEEKLSANNCSNEKTREQGTVKKPYTTPTLRFESVFEVSALACGKLNSTQAGCHFSTKAS